MEISLPQIILFVFSGLLFVVAVVFIHTNKKGHWFLVIAFFLAVLAFFQPSSIKWIKATRKGLEFERYIPSPEDRTSMLYLAPKLEIDDKSSNLENTLTKEQFKEFEKFTRDAKSRPDSTRSIEDYLILATDAWREEYYDTAFKYAFYGLSLNPSESKVKANLIHRLASIYHSLKLYDFAEKRYLEAASIAPNFIWPHLNLGYLYRDTKRPKKAIFHFKNALLLNPKDGEPHYRLARIYSNLGLYDEAETHYKKAIELDISDSLYTYMGLGKMYEKLERYSDAAKQYEKAIEVDPINKDERIMIENTKYDLGELYMKLNRMEEAKAIFDSMPDHHVNPFESKRENRGSD